MISLIVFMAIVYLIISISLNLVKNLSIPSSIGWSFICLKVSYSFSDNGMVILLFTLNDCRNFQNVFTHWFVGMVFLGYYLELFH